MVPKLVRGVLVMAWMSGMLCGCRVCSIPVNDLRCGILGSSDSCISRNTPTCEVFHVHVLDSRAADSLHTEGASPAL